MSVIPLLVFFVMAVTTAMDDQQCGDDYWPCRCHKFRIFSPFHTQSKTHTEMRTNVHCERADARVITDVFARRDNTRHRDIHDLMIELSPESNSTHLEPDLLKGNRARRIRLICPNHHHRLTIHPEAFRASMDYTWEVFLEGCDLSELDFVFLDNFSALTELYIRHSEIGTFHGLPPSIPLKILDINHCEHGFHWNVSDLPHDLSILRLDRNHLDDKTVAAILRSAARSSLSDLVLSNNMLSRIPDEISTLPTPLRKLKLIGNTIPQIKAESFRFSSDSEIQKRNGGGVHLTVLNLGHVSLKSIQPGTFQPGMDFVDCLIHLNDNRLTEFSSTVYQPVLEAMYRSNLISPHRGAVYIDYNPIECDCKLSWLIRDNRHLMPFVRGATCANSTSFHHLNPYGFDHCEPDNQVIDLSESIESI